MDILIAAEDTSICSAGLTEYEEVNTARVWRTVVEELPLVIAKLDPLFPERPKR
jgi:hypothetical protein